jgi:pimeloyl-ACP methyl ester carboxylesterase
MAMLQDVRAVGMAALQLPRVLRQRECGTTRYLAERNARYPVLLVHGYAASESVWTPLRRALGQAGFGHIVSLNYNSFAMDPVAVSAELTRQALRTLAAAGAPRIHLIGRSLGGLIIRRALAASAALSLQTASAVTIASPHRGALLARIAPGRCARIMHRGPRSELPRVDAPRPARWLAYYSDADRVVSPASARLDDARFGAVNVLIPGCGHLTICCDVRLIRSLVPELIRTETLADPAGSADADGDMHGVTVNSFPSVSLDPMLVLVCLNETSRGAGLIERAGTFVVNVLSAGQQDLSRWYTVRTWSH